jgi:hypothetical protein
VQGLRVNPKIIKDNKNKLKNERLGAGRVAQVVECLLSKHKALSSNSSATKKKKN